MHKQPEGLKQAVEFIERAARAPTQKEKRAILRALRGNEHLEDAVCECLRGKADGVHAALLAVRLFRLNSHRIVFFIIEATQHADTSLKAVQALREMGENALPEMVNYLCRDPSFGLLIERRAIAELVASRWEKAKPMFEQSLRAPPNSLIYSPFLHDKAGVLEALIEIDKQAAICELAFDSKMMPKVVFKGWGERKIFELEAEILAVFLNEKEEPKARGRAGELLRRMERWEVLVSVALKMLDGSIESKREGARLLARTPPDQVDYKVLMKLAGDEDKQVRAVAVKTLTCNDETYLAQLLPYAVRLLETKHEDVRKSAQAAIDKLTPEMLPQILSAARELDYYQARAIVDHVMRRFSGIDKGVRTIPVRLPNHSRRALFTRAAFN